MAELLPWLLQTLKSESSAVDRSGAAQGLSEVLLAQGYDRLAQLMPRFIESSQNPDNPTHVRDGYLMLFVYLPIAFGDEFTPFLADLLPCILKVSVQKNIFGSHHTAKNVFFWCKFVTSHNFFNYCFAVL